MRRRLIAGACVLAACAMVAPGVSAHSRIRAVITFDPVRPITGEDCTVRVRFETLAGVPQAMGEYTVRFVGEMTGHAMRPVEAVLVSSGTPGEFAATIAFTMAGPWRVTVRAEGHDTISGTTAVEVALEPDPPAAPATAAAPPVAAAPLAVVDMDPPEPVSPVSPWTILLGAIALTATAEGVAIARKLLRAAPRT
jgi:hypothetical protein